MKNYPCGDENMESAKTRTGDKSPVMKSVREKIASRKGGGILIILLIIIIVAAVFLFTVLLDDEDDYYDDYYTSDEYGDYEDDDSDYSDYGNDNSNDDEDDDDEDGGGFLSWLFGDDDDDDYESYNDSGNSGTASTVHVDASNFRSHYVSTSSAKSVTMMIYLIGSDLESDGGAASADMQEMLEANLGNNLKLAIQTGGCSDWQNKVVSSSKRQRWIMDANGLDLAENVGSGSMSTKSSVTDFITWAAKACPADRYILVFWDHGGGTIGGYGVDELYPDDILSILDIANAIKSSGVKFDIVGFDACLMATVENAYALEPVADYLLASEEYEPGDGWYYTDFLTKLGKNPSMSSVDLGKLIIDDFHSYYGGEDVTLSIVDLAEIPNIYENLGTFLSSAKSAIRSDNSQYSKLSKAISKARSYCDDEIDQIDMLDMVRRTSFDGAKDLENAILSAVKYRNNSSLSGSYGLAMYFPYKQTDEYSGARKILNGIGFSDPTASYDYFMSIRNGGQTRSGGSTNRTQTQTQDYSSESWYQSDANSFDYGEEVPELTLDETDDGFVLKQNNAFWNTITDIQLQVMVDYDDGYIDLGLDNITSWTDDEDLLLDYDFTWLALNGEVVPFYADETEETKSGATVYSGRVYAELNEKETVELYLEWDPQDGTVEDLKGHVLGYRISDPDSNVYAKGLKTLKAGDTLAFLCDWYPNDGSDAEELYIGDPITVGANGEITVEYIDLDVDTVICWYRLINIYGQELYTETVEFSLS